MNKLSLAAREEVLKNQQVAFEAVKHEKEAKEKFARNLLLTQENERKRIAGELHDSLGQELLIIKNRAILGTDNNCDDSSRLKHLNEISSLSTQAINEVRQITYNLRPYQLDRVGLTKALQSLITRLESSSEIKFKMFVDNIDNLFSNDCEINIYRMVQEATNNVIKHSSASSAVLMVSKENDKVCITVEDNGKGFKLPLAIQQKHENSGFGLTGISERAHILGGTCEIISAPGRGTVIKIELPIFNS